MLGRRLEVRLRSSYVALRELWQHIILLHEKKRVSLAHLSRAFAEGDSFSRESRKSLSDKQVSVVYAEENILEISTGF